MPRPPLCGNGQAQSFISEFRSLSPIPIAIVRRDSFIVSTDPTKLRYWQRSRDPRSAQFMLQGGELSRMVPVDIRRHLCKCVGNRVSETCTVVGCLSHGRGRGRGYGYENVWLMQRQVATRHSFASSPSGLRLGTDHSPGPP